MAKAQPAKSDFAGRQAFQPDRHASNPGRPSKSQAGKPDVQRSPAERLGARIECGDCGPRGSCRSTLSADFHENQRNAAICCRLASLDRLAARTATIRGNQRKLSRFLGIVRCFGECRSVIGDGGVGGFRGQRQGTHNRNRKSTKNQTASRLEDRSAYLSPRHNRSSRSEPQDFRTYRLDCRDSGEFRDTFRHSKHSSIFSRPTGAGPARPAQPD